MPTAVDGEATSPVRRARTYLRACAAAFTFLTRVPAHRVVRHDGQDLANAAPYFPLVGVVVGAVGGAAFAAASLLWPTLLAIIISVAATVWMTGAFHEDALADALDGFGGGWDRAQILAIMKDSRVGSYALVGVALVLGAKVAALATIAGDTRPAIGATVARAHRRTRSRPMVEPPAHLALPVRTSNRCWRSAERRSSARGRRRAARPSHRVGVLAPRRSVGPWRSRTTGRRGRCHRDVACRTLLRSATRRHHRRCTRRRQSARRAVGLSDTRGTLSAWGVPLETQLFSFSYATARRSAQSVAVLATPISRSRKPASMPSIPSPRVGARHRCAVPASRPAW